MTEIVINEINSLDALQAIEDEWHDLHATSKNSSFYNSFDFIFCSYKHFLSQSSRIVVITLRQASDQSLVAVFPLQRAKHRIYGIVLDIIEYGCCDESDKPYPLLPSGQEAQCWLHLINYLLSHEHHWDFIEMMELREEKDDLEQLKTIAQKNRLIARDTPDAKGPLVALDGDWDEFWNKHKKMRQKVRAMEKKLGEDFSFTVFEKEEDALPCLEQYMALEGTTWKAGKVGIAKNETSRQFYRDLFARISARGNLFFGYIHVNDQLASAEIAYRHAKTLYFSHGCFSDDYKKFSPGMVSTSLFIKHFHGKGYYEGDFLSGFAHYLNPWAKSIVYTRRLTLYRRTLKSCLVLMLLWCSQSVYRPIKNAISKKSPA